MSECKLVVDLSFGSGADYRIFTRQIGTTTGVKS